MGRYIRPFASGYLCGFGRGKGGGDPWPGFLVNGSNAMGGVVNIITRQHNRPGRRTQARIMYGSYNTQKYMINNGYNIGNFSSYISLNHDRTDGHRPDSKFHITNGFAKLGYKIDDIIR